MGGTACSNEEATCSRMNVVPGPFAGQGRTWYRSHLMVRHWLDPLCLGLGVTLSCKNWGIAVDFVRCLDRCCRSNCL